MAFPQGQISQSKRRAALCRWAGDPLPPPPNPVLSTLGDIWVCDPCPKAMVLTEGFYQNHPRGFFILPHLHPICIERTTVLNIIQSTHELEKNVTTIYLTILVYVLLLSLRQKQFLKCVWQSKPSINLPNTFKELINTEKGGGSFKLIHFTLIKLETCLSQNSQAAAIICDEAWLLEFYPMFCRLAGKKKKKRGREEEVLAKAIRSVSPSIWELRSSCLKTAIFATNSETAQVPGTRLD